MVTRRTIKCDRIDAIAGDAGPCARFGGSEFYPGGSLFIAAGADITLGAGGGALKAAGGDFNLDGFTGVLTLAAGDQLVGHGIPKIKSISVPYTDFTAAATTDFTDYTVESTFDWILLDWFARLTIDFVGGTLSAVEMTLGDASSPTIYLPTSQIDLFTGAPAFHGGLASSRGNAINTFGFHKNQISNIIRVALNTTGDNCDAMTDGALTLYVRYFTLPN